MNTLSDLHFYRKGDLKNPAILFIHGFMGSGTDWNVIFKHLSAEFYCLAVDLPGHGKSILNNTTLNYSMPNTAKSIVDFLQTNDFQYCHLIGYSMGGRLAIFLAVNFPAFFKKIVIESASPGIKSITERKLRLEHDFDLADKLESVEFKDFLSDWYNQPIFYTLKNSRYFANLIKARSENDPHELAKSLRKMSVGNQPSLWDELHTIKNEVLLVYGEFDNKYRNIVQQMKREIKNAKITLIKNAGHNTHLENQIDYIKYVKKFLATTRRQMK
ncbi:2-succinyl-6-hydroxy-2,4-cyclohexadiene-1-carboxylate synthase [Calditrichota bacterium]